MRVLLLADIHANWPALQAITEAHDVCLFLGDLVDYGLEPSPCIQWVRERAHYTVRGNHDHGVAQNVTVLGRNGFVMAAAQALQYLGSLPRVALARKTSTSATY